MRKDSFPTWSSAIKGLIIIQEDLNISGSIVCWMFWKVVMWKVDGKDLRRAGFEQH